MNLDEATPKLEVGGNNFIITTQQRLTNGNLLLFIYLPTRKTQRIEPLIDYFQSHVVISE